MPKPSKKHLFKLEIPFDTSEIEKFQPGKGLKVLLVDRSELRVSQIVQLGKRAEGKAVFSFTDRPQNLRVIIGPEDADEEELLGLQTLTLDLSSQEWQKTDSVKITPIRISSYYWHWWQSWCQTFTITGKVVCPDGRPVPGAKVSAKDVNFFWWWSSIRQVSTATTDYSGSFKMNFRWCCGWLPYWWWARRNWRLEPSLVSAILPTLAEQPYISKVPVPTPTPDFEVFQELLSTEKLPLAPSFTRPPSVLQTMPALQRAQMANVNVELIGMFRESLKNKLPEIPLPHQLKLWPWYSWYPWWDCTPDIIFQVTQNCTGKETVIVDEEISNTRWNIPSNLNVTLVSNGEACCIEEEPQPEGNCINLTHICHDPISEIGGNLGAGANPVGYRNPGIHSIYGDRPYAGNVTIQGDFGTLSGADFYEVEWRKVKDTVWRSMPPGAFSGFNRRYYGPQLPTGPVNTWTVPFHVQTVDGRQVIESRQHFEANNGAGTWHIPSSGSRWWTHRKNFLGTWHTRNLFVDGTYELRVKTWKLIDGHLEKHQILGQCGSEQEVPNYVKVHLDNRVVGTGIGSHRGYPCGPGTVHTCTEEPDTAILRVSIQPVDDEPIEVKTCGEQKVNSSDKLIIDFVVHDPEGHLAIYTLKTTYGHSNAVDLLNQPSSVLSPSPVPPSWVTPTSLVGPYYAHSNPLKSAIDQGAISPHWNGGAMRLVVDVKEAFPESCCYQLELKAYKRTIVNCSESLNGHTNYTEFSFMIVV